MEMLICHETNEFFHMKTFAKFRNALKRIYIPFRDFKTLNFARIDMNYELLWKIRLACALSTVFHFIYKLHELLI